MPEAQGWLSRLSMANNRSGLLMGEAGLVEGGAASAEGGLEAPAMRVRAILVGSEAKEAGTWEGVGLEVEAGAGAGAGAAMAMTEIAEVWEADSSAVEVTQDWAVRSVAAAEVAEVWGADSLAAAS